MSCDSKIAYKQNEQQSSRGRGSRECTSNDAVSVKTEGGQAFSLESVSISKLVVLSCLEMLCTFLVCYSP